MYILLIVLATLLIFAGTFFLLAIHTRAGFMKVMTAVVVRYSNLTSKLSRSVTFRREKNRIDMKAARGRLIPTVSIDEFSITGPAGKIPVRLYKPNTRKDLPLVIFFHGGGYVVGTLDDNENMFRTVCSRLGVAVLAPAYRLAPEHPFPAALDDCRETVLFAERESAQLGINKDKIILMGDSAGGGLALSTAIHFRDAGKRDLIKAVTLLYPWVNPSSVETRSFHTYRKGFLLTEEDILWYRHLYCPDERQLTDPRVSPLLADLSGLNRVNIVSARMDVLFDEGAALKDKLQNAGVPVNYHIEEGTIHGFFALTGFLGRQIKHTCAFLKKCHEEMGL